MRLVTDAIWRPLRLTDILNSLPEIVNSFSLQCQATDRCLTQFDLVLLSRDLFAIFFPRLLYWAKTKHELFYSLVIYL